MCIYIRYTCVVYITYCLKVLRSLNTEKSTSYYVWFFRAEFRCNTDNSGFSCYMNSDTLQRKKN